MTETADPAPTQGASVEHTDHERFNLAIDWAVDYRGDVTLITDDGDEIECYVFDRQQASDGSQGSIRYMTKAALERTPIQIQHISEIRFSGKDTAAGKSFERWIAKYIEKKMAGETASIDCDSLDDQ
jgi:hypothetical protein